MRKFIFLSAFFGTILLNACAKEANGGNYEIKGKIGNYGAPAKIYLQYIENNEVSTHSASLNDGKFSFSGKIQFPANGRLVIVPDGTPINNQVSYEHTLSIIVAAETITVNSPDIAANAVIAGSIVNDELKKHNKELEAIMKQKNNLLQEYYNSPEEKKANVEFMSFVQNRLAEIDNNIKETQKKFISENPKSYVSLMILEGYLNQNQVDMAEFNSLFLLLSLDIQNSPTGRIISAQLSEAMLTAIGSAAPDFEQNTPDGKPVKLSDFKGKYLLVDFWASWCGPCRKENPNVVKAYNQYKDKNFDVLGVSLDNPGAKQNWLNAIRQDGLIWTHVSDLKGWQNAVAIQYGIQSIPQNLLLDPNGVIIAKNLRGDNLSQTLENILK